MDCEAIYETPLTEPRTLPIVTSHDVNLPGIGRKHRKVCGDHTFAIRFYNILILIMECRVDYYRIIMYIWTIKSEQIHNRISKLTWVTFLTTCLNFTFRIFWMCFPYFEFKIIVICLNFSFQNKKLPISSKLC